MNVYKITTREGAVKYVAWGNAIYLVPAGITEMTTVIPKVDGSYSWQLAQPGEAISLSPNPILLK
jgi:amino acid permease